MSIHGGTGTLLINSGNGIFFATIFVLPDEFNSICFLNFYHTVHKTCVLSELYQYHNVAFGRNALVYRLTYYIECKYPFIMLLPVQ